MTLQQVTSDFIPLGSGAVCDVNDFGGMAWREPASAAPGVNTSLALQIVLAMKAEVAPGGRSLALRIVHAIKQDGCGGQGLIQ